MKIAVTGGMACLAFGVALAEIAIGVILDEVRMHRLVDRAVAAPPARPRARAHAGERGEDWPTGMESW